MNYFFIILLLSYLLGNVYVFIRGLQAISHAPVWLKAVYCTVFWIFVLLLFAFFVFRNTKVPFDVGHMLFLTASGWLVFTLYMVILLGITDLIKVFNNSFHYGFLTSLILTVSLLVYGFINYQHPVKQVFNIVINKFSTSSPRHLKIVAVSDIHLGYGTDKTLLHKNIDRINAEKPDIILIGGDLIDNSVVPVEEEEMERELNRLEAPLGVFMTPGNHEYISGSERCKNYIETKTKIRYLQDEIVMLRDSLQLLGRDDRSNRRRRTAEYWRQHSDPRKPLIIIDHQPYNLNEAQELNADLQFSGHTHHGQVFPINLLTKSMFDIAHGYEKRGDTHYFVSSGLAVWGPPFRIGTNSEYIIFNIRY
ncbi:MAG: metallophosphoesterase [Tannerella sp.]|jgi:predicted MPP superfamily phosphohydrolase|nr:metallophosphoesterase [Tannerella sp.]